MQSKKIEKFSSDMAEITFSLADDITPIDISKFGDLAFEKMKIRRLGFALAEVERKDEEKEKIFKENLLAFRQHLLLEFFSWFISQLQIFGYSITDQELSNYKIKSDEKSEKHFIFPVKNLVIDYAKTFEEMLNDIKSQSQFHQLHWIISEQLDSINIKLSHTGVNISIIHFNDVAKALKVVMNDNTQCWDFWNLLRKQLLITKLFTLPGLTNKQIMIIDRLFMGYSTIAISEDLNINLQTLVNIICETRKEYGEEVVPEAKTRKEFAKCLYSRY